jgi:hypothetical protein
MQKYILLRRTLAGQSPQDPNVDSVVKELSPPPESEVKPATDTAGDTKSSRESPETHSGESPLFFPILFL